MTDETPKMYCANHPNVETTLRCNKCEKPICAKCAILTPTGYRCKECVRGQQKIFETAKWVDYPIIFGVVAILAYLGSLIAFRLGFFIIYPGSDCWRGNRRNRSLYHPPKTLQKFIYTGSHRGSGWMHSTRASIYFPI